MTATVIFNGSVKGEKIFFFHSTKKSVDIFFSCISNFFWFPKQTAPFRFLFNETYLMESTYKFLHLRVTAELQ